MMKTVTVLRLDEGLLHLNVRRQTVRRNDEVKLVNCYTAPSRVMSLNRRPNC